MTKRAATGRRSQRRGVAAEAAVCAALEAERWSILARRLRTQAGEIDVIAEKDGLLAVIEVKARPSLSLAAASLGSRQRTRLIAAAEIALAANPGWGPAGVRFDLLLVDPEARIRRIADAFRVQDQQ